MTNDKIFQERQADILSLANTEAGRHLLNCRVNAPIVKVTPTAVIYRWGKELRGEFYCYERQAKILLPILIKMDLANEYKFIDNPYKAFLHYSNLERGEYPQIFLNQQNFYAGAGDGYVSRDNVATWANARDTADGEQADSTTTADADGCFRNERISSSNFTVARGYFPTVTSTIGSGATVTAAIFNVYVSNLTDANSTTLEIVTTSQASTSTLVVGDFDALTFTSRGSKALASLTNNAMNTVTITTLSLINVTGTTMLGTIGGMDLSNTAPPSDSNTNRVGTRYSEYAGTDSDPYIDITWSRSGFFPLL